MDIIGHTATLNKNKGALNHFLITNGCDMLEMDFVLTMDNILVWSHDSLVDGKLIRKSKYKDIKQLLTLEEVLEILDGEVDLLLDLKWIDKKIPIEELLMALEISFKYSRDISIQSVNQNLVRILLTYKFDKHISIGLVVNLFKTFIYRKGNILGLEKIDFLSLSSELWESSLVGEDYKIYRELFPRALEYAWTWDSVYTENEIRIKNYINKKADGIITSDVPLVRTLIK